MIILWVLLGIIGAIVLFILFTVISCLFINKKKEYTKNSRFYRFLLNSWTWLALKVMRIKIHTQGTEYLPKNTRFLIVGNHRSNYDPIVTWAVLKKYDVAFLSKKSNLKIPIFGRMAKKCCFMEIDRDNAREAIKTINNASKLINNNIVSIGVYPEGTRSKTKELLPFHNGVFKIAKKANVPIVVLAVEGTDQIIQNYPWRKSHVYLNFVDIIPTDEVASSDTLQIGERVREKLIRNLEEKNEKDDKYK